MAIPEDTPARVYANRMMRRLHEALKPLLARSGVRVVEERIGRPRQFFSKSRERDALRLSDFLATCAVIEEAPEALLATALAGDVPQEVRPPRIVRAAWERFETPGEGVGRPRLAELEALRHSDPRGTRRLVAAELTRSTREEVPELLGIYAATLRADADLAHAWLVLREAREMVRQLDGPGLEADLLIRMAYLALEYQSPVHALRLAQDAMIAFAREGDLEGEGKSFIAMGIFRYYNHEYREAIRDLSAALERCHDPRRIVTAHQVQGLAWVDLGAEDEARKAAAAARACTGAADASVEAKLSWLEAKVSHGMKRIGHFKDAQTALASLRPSDCIMVTVELIEEHLACGRISEAADEVPLLCTLIERSAESRQVQRLSPDSFIIERG